MRRNKSSSINRILVSFLLVFGGILIFSGIGPVKATSAPNVNTPVLLGTGVTGTPGTNVNMFGQMPSSTSSCFMSGVWIAIWMHTNPGSSTFAYSYSSDGLTWAAQADFWTTTNVIGSTDSWAMTCGAPTAPIMQIIYSNSGANDQVWYNNFNFGTITAPTKVFGSDQLVSNLPAATKFGNVISDSYDSGGNFVAMAGYGLSTNAIQIVNGAWIQTFTVTAGAYEMGAIGHDANTQNAFFWGGFTQGGNAAPNINWYATNYQMTLGTKSTAGYPVEALPVGGVLTVVVPFSQGAAQNSQTCQLQKFNTQTRTYSTVTPAGASTSCSSGSTFTSEWGGSDSALNVWLVFGSVNQIFYSSDGGLTWTVLNFVPKIGVTTLTPYAFTGIVNNNGNLQGMIMETDTAGNFYSQLVGQAAVTNPATQTQTIGSCPTKNTATFTMVNNTLYFYYGTTPGQGVVNTITVGVSSIGGVTGTHTLGFYIYYAQSPGAISGSNQLIQAFAFTKAFTSGSTHFVYNLQVASSLIPQGVTWGVGVVGDNKINLNQSSLSGLYTQAGVASNAVQSGFFTTQGTSVATELYVCSTLNYQTSSTTTVTTTASTTITLGTTTTSTATVLNPNAIAGTLPGVLLDLILIVPLAIIGARLAGMSGMMFGSAIGIGLGVAFGGLPFYWVFLILVAGIGGWFSRGGGGI